MFGRKKPVSPDTYRRWLRAQRPDWDWFLTHSELEQEGLADLGDEYVQDFCVGIGYTVNDPEMADAGRDADTNPESEEVLARRLAAGLVQRAIGHEPPPVPKPKAEPATMGGHGKRNNVVFMGAPPDEPKAEEESSTHSS